MRYFIIYSNCILTKGANRTSISDTQKKQIYFIPNSLYEDILKLKKIDFDSFCERKSLEEKTVLNSYIDLFIDEGLGFFTSQKDSFPDINLEYYSPEIINNAIIDIDDKSDFQLNILFSNLKEFQCKFIEIRIYSDFAIQELKSMIEMFDLGFLNNLDIIMKFPSNQHDLQLIENLMIENKIIGRITLHSSNENGRHKDLDIFKIKKNVTSCLGCGQIDQKYFSLNLKTISESQKYNTCLHKKISVDIKGNIKNCPSMPKSFGNIKNTTLNEALNHRDFKKYWNITKEQIEVCKDCEFRNLCTDCRSYIEDPKDIYSKPLKCGYSPYTNRWENWSLNPIKKQISEYYSLNVK